LRGTRRSPARYGRVNFISLLSRITPSFTCCALPPSLLLLLKAKKRTHTHA